jgi:hypothetical protein
MSHELSVKIYEQSRKTHTIQSKKKKPNPINKKDLWNIFEHEIEEDDKKIPLECIYRECGNREFCERWNYLQGFS